MQAKAADNESDLRERIENGFDDIRVIGKCGSVSASSGIHD